MNHLAALFGAGWLFFFAYKFWDHNRPLAITILAFAFLAPVVGKLAG